MALTPEQEVIVGTLQQIYAKRKQINDLNVERNEKEKTIAIEYKVDECNAKRNTLINEYATLLKPLRDELTKLEQSLVGG